MKTLKLILKNYLLNIKCILIDDETAVKKEFKKRKGYLLDLNNVKTFSEKINYIKLYDHNPLMVVCSDKYRVYEYLKLLDLEYLFIDIIKVYNDPNEINFSELPNDFIIKMNNMSGHNFIINQNIDKNETEIKKHFKAIFKRNFYKLHREWAYKNIEPLVIVQKIIENKDKSPLVDYKFYCFEGRVEYFGVSIGEYDHHVRNHKYDRNLNSIDYLFKKESSLSSNEISLPSNIKEMISIADKLSKPFHHVRVDLYNVDGRIYFGELTFYCNGGYIDIDNKDMDLKIGSLIKL